jgi:antitoxin PrlF
MTYTSIVSTKGQVTIPQEIRVRLGLKEGDRIEFVTEGEKTLIRPARTSKNPFDAYVGILGPFPGGLQGIKGWIADMRDEDEPQKK